MKDYLKSKDDVLEAVIETSPAGITVLDRDGNIIYANLHAQKILGLSKNEILSRSYDDEKWTIKDIEGATLPSEELPFALVKKTKEPVFNIKHSIQSEGKEPILLSVNMTPLFNSEGQFDGAVGNLKDITSELKTFRKFKTSQWRLKERIKELNGLYQLSKILTNPNLSVEEMLEKVADLLPPAFQFPEITRAQLIYNHLKFESNDFKVSDNRLSSKIKFKYGLLKLNIFYIENKPFLDEEQDLIDEFLRRIKEYLVKRIEEKKYKNLFHSSPYPIVLIDLQGKIIDRNKTSEGFLGYENEEVVGKKIYEVMSIILKGEPEHLKKRLRKLFNNGKTSPDVYKVKRKNGKNAWIKIQSSLMHLGDQKIIQSIIQDITKEKKIEENLRNVNEKKSEILRKTSHDLKTPLISIKGYTDLLLKSHSNEFSKKALEKIQYIKSGCDRLKQNIDEILEGSKLKSANIRLNKTKNNFKNMVERVVKELKPRAKSKNLDVITHLEEDLITQFERDQINEVIGNLMMNAIKYTPSEGNIKISAWKDEDYITVSVSDDGIGLTEEEKQHLFEKYTTFPRDFKDLDIEKEGSGLGLYFSKKIIERHGGRIWADSDGRGKGTTFYFSLPLLED